MKHFDFTENGTKNSEIISLRQLAMKLDIGRNKLTYYLRHLGYLDSYNKADPKSEYFASYRGNSGLESTGVTETGYKHIQHLVKGKKKEIDALYKKRNKKF